MDQRLGRSLTKLSKCTLLEGSIQGRMAQKDWKNEKSKVVPRKRGKGWPLKKGKVLVNVGQKR